MLGEWYLPPGKCQVILLDQRRYHSHFPAPTLALSDHHRPNPISFKVDTSQTEKATAVAGQEV